VASFPVSSAFVGRAADLARLEAAARDPLVTAVLVSGEAGLGKSRLVSEFLTRLDTHTVVLTGRCPELGADGVPFAPFLAMMRTLRPADPPVVSGGEMLTALDRLAREHPVVLVVEDLHWADESSLDLLAFLIANLAHCGVHLVATHRPAGDGRLRGMLAELRRLPSVTAIELRPITRHEVGRQLAALLGREPKPGFAGRVYERSQGYPLFVEALAHSSGETPADLRELVLAWMAGLPGDERAVLRTAAVAGTPAGHRLLAEAADLPDQRVEDAIAALAAARLLVVHESGYEFRHVLFRQVVYEDLLPAARTRLHARLTAVLAADPSLLPAESYAAQLAQHATQAADWPAAIAASWQAAEIAADNGGRPEQIRHLARIRELWDKAPDAAADLPVCRVGLLERLAGACAQRGVIELGLVAVDEALAVASTNSPYQVAKLLLLRARLGNQDGGGQDDLRRALALLAAESGAATEPDALVAALRGAVLAELASAQMFDGNPAGAAASAGAALDAAGRAGQHGDTALAARAHAMLGLAAADSGTAAAMAHLATARSLSPDASTRLIVATWESAVLVAAGQYETAIEAIQQGLRAAHEAFRFVDKGPVLTVKWVQALAALGRWPQALDLIEETLTGQVPPFSRAVLLLCHAKIKLAQGDPAAAHASVQAAEPVLSRDGAAGPRWGGQYRLELAAVTADLADPDHALGQLTDALTAADPSVDHHAMWPMLVQAARRVAESDKPGSEPGADLRALAATLRCTTRPDAACRRAVTAALTGQAHQWKQAAQAWEELRQPFEHAQALLAAARAHILAGDRPDARTALQTALTIARELGARPLAEQAERTALRAGLSLAAEGTVPDTAAQAGNSSGLTARELDVLRLIATGLSNRQIGIELFISSNTAGVHVSRILAKLGAATRTQAAAIARERNLVR
jgi:DNA-binding CsgD family transcriptional regulator